LGDDCRNSFCSCLHSFYCIEAFGLIGVFTSLQTIMSLLDMGLTTTLNRELSKHAAIKNEE
jgi:hypothetical protein